MIRGKKFVDVLNEWLSSKLDKIHTVLPGRIEHYYGHTQRKAKVQPLVKLRNIKNKIIEINPIDDVPILFPGSSNTNILFPINKNDGCLLLFAESAIGNWLSNGGVVEADDLSRFDLTDCIAIPGLWSFANAPILPFANDNDFFIFYENAKIQIEKTTNTVNINDNLEVLI